MEFIGTIFSNLAAQTGFSTMFADGPVVAVKYIIMLAVACVLLYLGIVKKFEPLLLVGIAFGMLLTNLPGAGIYHPELWYAGAGANINFGEVRRFLGGDALAGPVQSDAPWLSLRPGRRCRAAEGCDGPGESLW